MADKPSVSVIIPTYNRASLIGAAIQSVLNQTFKSVEIIVVDDGSTDETQRALEPHAGKIVSLATKNNGPAHARNVGMKAASGTYIAFLDSDDMYLPHKLELEVAFMETHPDIGMVSTNMSAMRGGEIVEEYHLNTYHGAFFQDDGQTLENIYPVRAAFEFHGGNIPCYSGNIFKQMLHWPPLLALTVLFRREDILSVVGYQKETYRLGEDYDYMVRICKHFAVACLDIPTYVYRYSEDQESMIGSTWSTKRHATWIRILETMLQVALEHGKSDIDYYSANRAWLDPLLSKKYSELGRKLIDFGDSKKARECFSKAHDYGPSHETFFRRMLGDVDEPTAPYGLTDVQGDGAGITDACCSVDPALAQRLRAQARALGVSAASIYHLAWAQVLARVSGREDVVFGTVLFGCIQSGESNDREWGPFISTLPVRICVAEENVQDGVRNTHETLEQLLRHKHAPLALVQRCSAVASPVPLFSALLNYRHSSVGEQPAAEANQGRMGIEFPQLEERSNYPLVLSVDDLGEGFALTARAQSPINPQRICSYMNTALEHLVGALETAPTASLRRLEVLPDTERHQLLVDLNRTNWVYPRNTLMQELFEAQAKRTPDRTALRVGVTALSYAELDRRASRMAQALRSRGVGRGQRVGLCVERDADMVAAVLGILKAGAAYVPLDPSFPAERLRFMAEDAQLTLLVSTSALVSPFGLPRERQLLLDIDADALAAQSDQRLMPDAAQDARAEDPAYIIYTSGSTGKPKGVLVPHHAVVNFLGSMAREPGLTADDVLVAVTTLSFDIAVLELQLPLTIGATVVIASREEASDGRVLGALLEQNLTTIVQATPVTWRLLLEAGWNGGKDFKALVGGEALPKDLADQLIASGVKLWNMYGPTETTVWSTCARITDTSNGITIGRPIANTTVYILDAQKNLCPIGVPGELCIGGDGVALGYWNRPDLSAERFIPDPFSTSPGATLYRTGDRARWRSDGTLEHLGRLDFQVKIRGYRIEVGEIEAGIAHHPAIRETAVVVREDVPGDPRLVAYVVVKNDAASHSVRGQGSTEWSGEHISGWQKIWDQTYLEPTTENSTFNIMGWNSSYTRARIPAEEMREWVDVTVDRIAARSPCRVLEIGCGTGLLLERLAPACEVYRGTDFSSTALDTVRRLIAARKELSHVELSQRLADDFTEIEPGSFDTVIINSVAQYLPSIEYLKAVLEGAAAALSQGGRIFVGDVRSLPLLKAFHASVQCYRAEGRTKKVQLRHLIENDVELEAELVIDPDFFLALKDEVAEISAVEILLKRGLYNNELTQFRYDVFVHVGAKDGTALPQTWLDWQTESLNLTALRRHLASNSREIGVRGIPNSRCLEAAKALAWLTGDNEGPQTLEGHRETMTSAPGEAVDPEALWTLAKQHGYAVELSYTDAGSPACMDALFRKHDTFTPGGVFWGRTASSPAKPWGSYSNNPLKGKLLRDMNQRLRKYLAETLPDYMVPSAFMVLNELPLTPSGKIDRKALPAPERSAAVGIAYIAPRTSTEKILAEIWGEALGLERVGIDVSFFDLGGHSLLAMQVLARARQALSVELSLREFLGSPTIAGLSACLELQSKNELQSGFNGAPNTGYEGSESVTVLPRIIPAPQDKRLPFPLTDIQQAYWVGRSGMFDLGNVATHVYTEYDCTELDLGRFSRAWQRLIERHDMLRAIVLPDGQQQILEEVPPYEIQVLDLRGQGPQAIASQLEDVRRKLSHQVLKSDRWPLFEIRASRMDGGRVRLHVSRDVLMVDGWSASILDRELCRLYQQPDAGLPPLEISFRDYVLAQAALRDTDLYRRSKNYWWDRLATLPAAPELPVAKAASLVTTPQFTRRSKQFEPLVWRSLKRRAARSGLTSSGLLLAVFADVLKLWSKSPRFTLNLTLANRLPLHPQVNDLVGDFTSVVLLAVDHSEEDTFEDRARRVQKQLWNDLDHRFVSGVEIMRELAKTQGNMRGGLMPVVFTSFLGQASSNEVSEQLGPVVYNISQTSQVSLDYVIFEVEGRLQFHWDAVEELFPEGLLDDMFDSYCRFLQRLADDENSWQEKWPETARDLLPVRQLEQRAQGNDTGAPISDHLLHSLFASQVEQRPQQAAVISAERTLSYEELCRRSNQIGHWLIGNGAQRNSLVAVVMEKGWEQVAGVLGVLASGAAYLPIDAGLPKDRLWHLLQHGEVKLVLTQPQFDKKIEWPDTIERLIIDEDSLSGLSEQPLDTIQSPEDIAYVIYTSGSTGLPKGVVIDHRGAVNTILDLNRRFTVTPKDRVLALSSLSFDLSVYDIFGILAVGGTIVVPDAAGLRDPAHWADLMARHRVTLWNSVPALMQMLVEYLEGRGQRLAQDLRLVFMSGDWIPVALPERILALDREVELVSMGGATEASIWSIIYPIEKVDPAWKSIPYGRPMVNQTFHVLNDVLEPCPVWVPGQLYIGGIGLAKGYWRDEEKTNASFITHPRTGQRLYRTGDQGRYLPDGNIEFLGRDDFQVKVQGYRIELGEIETILTQHPRVQTAAVVAIGPVAGNKKLVAYIVPEGQQASDDRQDEATPNASNGHSNGRLASGETLRDPLARIKFKLKKPGMRIDTGRTAIQLKKTEATDEFLESYTSRRSYRKFASGTVSFDRFSHVLNNLSPVKIDDTPFPKYRYASAGGLYPVQTYLYIKPDRVEGLAGGSYFYDAANHSLSPLSPGSLIPSAEFQGSQAIFDQSAFALFFVAQLKSIAPMYGDMARDFCVIEAGSMCQLLETSAPSHQIGLCQIGGLDFQPIRHLFDLEGSHLYLHCLLGGPIAAQQSKRPAFVEEMSEYANFLRTLEEQPASSQSDEGIAEGLHYFLQGKLPDYMIPANFVVLDKLPLSSNGKVDRKALPEPAALNAERVQDLPKEWTGQTARIACLVEDVLKVKNFDPETNLFDLGATSVDVIRIINWVERELNFRPKIEAFYRLPTVAALTHSYEQHLLHKSPLHESRMAVSQGDFEEGTL